MPQPISSPPIFSSEDPRTEAILETLNKSGAIPGWFGDPKNPRTLRDEEQRYSDPEFSVLTKSLMKPGVLEGPENPRTLARQRTILDLEDEIAEYLGIPPRKKTSIFDSPVSVVHKLGN